jgi:hypothetical protein
MFNQAPVTAHTNEFITAWRRFSPSAAGFSHAALSRSLGMFTVFDGRNGLKQAIAFHETGSDLLLGFVVPHFRFGQQSPALERAKYRTLAAQGFHCTVANEVIHLSPPACLYRIILQPIPEPSHHDSIRKGPPRDSGTGSTGQ